MWIIHIIEGVRFNGGHPFFLGRFLHDSILPPGGIKSEFHYERNPLGENQRIQSSG